MVKIGFKAKVTQSKPMLGKTKVKQELRPIVNKFGKKLFRADLRGVMQGWSSESKAKLVSRSGYSVVNISSSATLWAATGTNEGSTPLRWLEEGTKKRWRVMGGKYRSKTWENSKLATRAGRGYAAGFTDNEQWAIENRIRARNFREGVIEKHERDFEREIEEAIVKMVQYYNK